MKALTFAIEKGGTGKTTASIHAAWYYAERLRVLLVDVDQQGNASSTLVDHHSGVPALNLFTSATAVPPVSALTVAYATPEIVDVERMDWDEALTNFQASIDACASHYDLVVIDTPPSLRLRTAAALLVADTVIAPVELGDYSIVGLRRLFDVCSYLSDRRGRAIDLALMVSKLDTRSKRERELSEQLVAEVGPVLLPDGLMKKRDAYSRAASERIPAWAMRGTASKEAGAEIRGIFAALERRMGVAIHEQA